MKMLTHCFPAHNYENYTDYLAPFLTNKHWCTAGIPFHGIIISDLCPVY